MDVLFILSVIIGIVLVIWYAHNNKKKGKGSVPSTPSYSKDELVIENVGPGGVIKLMNIGPDLKEFDVNIVSKHVYRQGESTWYELEGDTGEDKVWIDMEEDDELELAICLKKIKLRELGITKNDLKTFDDREAGELKYNDETFYYEDSDKAVFYRHGDDKNAESFYYWDFENDNGTKYIGVERWSDGSYDVSLSEPIKRSQVTVYSLKA